MKSKMSGGSVLDFFSLFDAIDLGIIVVNKNHEVVVWNDWVIKYSLIDLDDALSRSIRHLFQDIPPVLLQMVDDTLSTGGSTCLSSHEHNYPLALYSSSANKQADKRIFQKISIRRLLMDGEFLCVIQIIDVTQEKERAIALKNQAQELKSLADDSKEKEIELSLIIDNSLDAIIRLNEKGHIINFYPSASKMFGYKEGEVINTLFSSLLLSPYDVEFEQFFDLWQETENTNIDGHAKALKNNQEVFDSEITINPVMSHGEVHFIMTVKDVSERKKVQDALYREKEQAEITLSSIDDGVITTDIIGRINFLNPAGEALIGSTLEQVKNKPITQVLNIQSELVELPTLTCISSGVKVESAEGDELILDDGSVIVLHQVATPIHNQVGDVVGSVLIFRDVSKSHRLANRLTWQASHDELTQLINRREFERQLEGALESARNEEFVHCLCFMDLDKFKSVNDTCGHAAGDELLKQLADIFRSKVRSADLLARLGGDEFAIILTQCHLEPAIEVAEKIRRAVDEFRFVWEGRSFQVGISIGLMIIDESSPNVGDVFVAADSACYAAKEAGRNRVNIYRQDDEEIVQRKGQTQWLVQLQEALDQDRFQLNYQAIMPIQDTDGATHYEILLRMIDDKGNIVPPGAFIPAAERYQMMGKIDRWVIKNTFDWMDNYWEKNDKEVFAINLSGQSIADTSLLDEIKEWIGQSSFDPKHLSFEITETAAISNLKVAQHFINDLKSLGCGFALDDFGSGLSSFGYLKNMPVDYLKIDGIFIRDIVSDPIDRAMVEAIHNVGRVLKLKTIAEFVENEDIIEILKEIGVDYAQGYCLDRPKPLPDKGTLSRCISTEVA